MTELFFSSLQELNQFVEKQEEKFIIIDFFAHWCGPCQMIKPVLEDIHKNQKNIKVISINIEENEKLAEEANIRSIPTLFLFKNNKKVHQHNGFLNKEQILNWIQKHN